MKVTLPMFRSRSLATLCCVIAVSLASWSFGGEAGKDGVHWYKGNTHAHTRWSDGDELPELVVDWFKSHGYGFLAVSDHDLLMQGERWAVIDSGKRPVLSSSIEKAKQRFGDGSVVLRDDGTERQVKLKTFVELVATFNEPGRFLLVQNEEIATNVNDSRVHLNAINLAECIVARPGKDVADAIQLNVLTVQEQSGRIHRPIVAHVNHPNWHDYDISAEDLAQVSAVKFFEVCNGGGRGIHNEGDATHPNSDKLWDVANTIRIAKMKAAPLYGVGSDDSHNYQQIPSNHANPGRAWIMVRAKDLSADALLDAMNRGDFYASTGVVLRDVAYDARDRTYKIAIQSEPGVHYVIEFVGTLEGANTAFEPIPVAANAESKRPGRKYSPEVGKVLASVQGDSATYKFTGKELYVRAVIRSDKVAPDPISDNMVQERAWCQPVGWEAK